MYHKALDFLAGLMNTNALHLTMKSAEDAWDDSNIAGMKVWPPGILLEKGTALLNEYILSCM